MHQKIFFLLIGLGFVLVFSLNNAYYSNLFILMGIRSLAVVGLSILIGRCAQASLGHGAFVALGAYSSVFFMLNLKMPFGFVCLLSIFFSTAVVCLLAFAALRLGGYYLAMVTLGFSQMRSTF